jgi:hypothetical protein
MAVFLCTESDESFQSAPNAVSSTIDVLGVTVLDMTKFAVESAFTSAVAAHLTLYSHTAVDAANVTITSLTSIDTVGPCIYEVSAHKLS